MKIRKLVIIFVMFAFLSCLFASDPSPEVTPPPKQVQALGANSFGPETIESIQTTGLVKLNRTIVSQNLTVNGSLISHGATIGSLDVTGEAHLTDTRIQNGGTIFGYLQTHHAIIEKPLIINGQKAIFTASKLAGITIRRMDAFKGKQIVELRQKTIVDGPICFESGKGEVHLYSGSQITGTLTGGTKIEKH